MRTNVHTHFHPRHPCRAKACRSPASGPVGARSACVVGAGRAMAKRQRPLSSVGVRSEAAGMTPSDPHILTAIDGGRGVIALDRPAALNALTLPMIRAIHDALRAFEHDPAVGVISIESSREGCFC